MINLDKLNDVFQKPFNGNEYGPLGSLYISRQAQAFYAVTEKEAREALQAEYSKPIEKNHATFLKNDKASTVPLVVTGLFSLQTVSKYDDSKVDNKLLLENMVKEFKCSAARAAEVIKTSRVRPEKKSLLISRVV